MATAPKTSGKRFDPAKPYGLVYGHISGKYEQDGIVFNGSGVPLDEATIAQDEQTMADRNAQDEAARQRELLNK